MNEVNLTELGIKDSRDLLKRKEISATELTNAYIQNIEESSKLNAFIEKTFDKKPSDKELSCFIAVMISMKGYHNMDVVYDEINYPEYIKFKIYDQKED